MPPILRRKQTTPRPFAFGATGRTHIAAMSGSKQPGREHSGRCQGRCNDLEGRPHQKLHHRPPSRYRPLIDSENRH